LTGNALRADVAHLKSRSITLPRVADNPSKWLPGSRLLGRL